jgi:hypothetical protein
MYLLERTKQFDDRKIQNPQSKIQNLKLEDSAERVGAGGSDD